VYPRWELDPRAVVSWIGAGSIAVLVLVLWFTRRRLSWAPILLVFASAVTLAPALGFVPVYPHRFSWVADHFAYLGSLPLIALAVLVADAIGRRFVPAPSRARAALALADAVLVALAARTPRSPWRARSWSRSRRARTSRRGLTTTRARCGSTRWR